MKGLQLHGVWLVLQMISTTEERVTYGNMNSSVTSEMILLPTPSISKHFATQTFLVRKSPRDIIGRGSTNIVQWSEITTSGMLTSVFTPHHTPSLRNFHNNTQSVREIFKITRIWSAGLQTISCTRKTLMRRNTSYMATFKVYPSIESSAVETQQSNIVRNSTTVSYWNTSANISETQARTSSTVHTLNTRVPQSKDSELRSSNEASLSTTDKSQVGLTVSSWRSSIESSSNDRILSKQTTQLSRIINVSLSAISVSVTGILTTRFSATSSYANKSHSIHPSSTLNLKTSKMLAHTTSTHRSSQFSRHGSNSYLTNTVYLSSTTTANNDSGISPTTVATAVQSISPTSPNKESMNGLESILGTLRLSATTRFDKDTYSTSAIVTELNTLITSSTFATKASVYHSRIERSEVTDESHEISSVVASPTTRRPPYTPPSGRGPSMPLYVLAICLPLAALLGFILAFVYFKRNKDDQRTRYSVTVEISAEKPDYEMKRMYSIIDVSSGINKDFLSGLESKKASSEILDQGDSLSVSFTKPDQTV